MGAVSGDQLALTLAEAGTETKNMSQYLVTTQTVVAMACPAYASFQALLTANTVRQASWLRYWLVLATLELCSLPLLHYKSSPVSIVALTAAKLLLLLWCQAPIKENGSDVIFGQVTYLRDEFAKASCAFMDDSEYEQGEKITIKYSLKRKFKIFLLRVKMKIYEMFDPN